MTVAASWTENKMSKMMEIHLSKGAGQNDERIVEEANDDDDDGEADDDDNDNDDDNGVADL